MANDGFDTPIFSTLAVSIIDAMLDGHRIS